MTEFVTSKDGTRIAYERMGTGPALILVDGALCHRGFGPMRELAQALADRFTVFIYDRRGRGESGDTSPYAVEKEMDDLRAVIAAAGGKASLFGASSGGAFALEAANRGLPVEKVALYEAPFIVDDTRAPLGDAVLADLKSLVAADRRGDAVKLFMRSVGVPGLFVAVMGLMPMWSKLKAIAHTLPYDFTLMSPDQRGQPFARGRWESVSVPTLVMFGGKSPAWMKNAAAALQRAIRAARSRELPGQTHMVKTSVLAPALRDFLSGSDEKVDGIAQQAL